MPTPKPCRFVGSSREDLRDLPAVVQDHIGQALFEVQLGLMPGAAKPLKGLKGGGVLEIVEDYATDTYRAVYTVRFAKAVYVLHVFQKKSTRGTRTSRQDIELVERRLREAEVRYEAEFGEGKEW